MKRLLLPPAAILTFVAVFLAGAVLWFTHQVEGRYFDSDGVRIHYTDEGSGPPIVLIHAFQQNSSITWRRFGIVRRLAKNNRVICIDLRGHGLSARLYQPEQYGAELAADVARLMEHLQIPAARVAGYSLGGLVALKLAEQHPERVSMLALCASGIYHQEPRKPPAPARFSSRGMRFAYWLAGIDYRCMQACWLGYHGLASDRTKLARYAGPVKVLMGERDDMMKSIDEMRGVFDDFEVRTYRHVRHANTMYSRQFRNDLCAFLCGEG